MRRAAALLLVLLAVIAAPARAQEVRTVEVSESAADAMSRAAPHFEEAQRRLASKEWDEAVAAYAKALLAIGDEAVLGGWRDQALYNTACAEARAGRTEKAADAFAKSVRDGLRPVVLRGPAGAWVAEPGLTLEHLLADADLDPIRKQTAYVDALKPYLAAGTPVFEFTRPETSSLVPVVIVLALEGADAARAVTPWRVAAGERRIAIVTVEGPIRPTPKERKWLLKDGDDRWAIAKIRETLDLVAKDVHVDRKRVFLVAIGERPGEAAWATALAETSRLAGFAAPGARFHAEWHADGVAALPVSWRVAVGTADEKAAKMLKDRGIDAARVEVSNDESKTAAAILDALLAK